MPLFTFNSPNGPEFVPCIGNRVVEPGQSGIDIPEEFVAGLPPDKWTSDEPPSDPPSDPPSTPDDVIDA